MFKCFICVFVLWVAASSALVTNHEEYQTALAGWSGTLQMYVDKRTM